MRQKLTTMKLSNRTVHRKSTKFDSVIAIMTMSLNIFHAVRFPAPIR